MEREERKKGKGKEDVVVGGRSTKRFRFIYEDADTIYYYVFQAHSRSFDSALDNQVCALDYRGYMREL